MRREKQMLLDEIKEKIENANGLIVARYKSLSGAKSRLLRDTVATANGEFEVVKKRIFSKAMKQSRYKCDVEHFTGDIGIFFAFDDAVALSKVALKYGDANNGAIELVGACVEGSWLSASEINVLAKLPGINEMRSQIVGTIAAPMQEILALFEAYLDANKPEMSEPEISQPA